MALNTGRNVGRLSIRVVPDTKKFRNELRDQLRRIENTTRMSVRVNKANLDRSAIREDIRRQMADLSGVDAKANVRVTIDSAKLKKTKLRKSIQAQFDKFDDIHVQIAAEIANVERFEKQVRDMVQRASRNEVKISANAFTAIASRQLSFVSRDRIVNLVVRVSKKSVATALTTLAALSGARLSWKWIDDLAQSMKNLDKNLPAILGWTTGITSLVASLFAATSGLVGIGEGLFSITPALLVLPGLLLNAAGSVTALIVALRNAGDELSPLKDDMSELGEIINGAFWSRARQPILDLVTGLMPQLRVAFDELASGIGDFTGAMSKAFGEELAGGRLESIFSGIAEGWRVLASGAGGFAGALVSLSQIAATYTPRLAGWFVRQANTFDAWLKAISEDGRLGQWMEDAIDSMYDLWDVTRGISGVFAGLWRAAEAAGSGGLAGFADMMLEWDRVVNGADFQRGLTAVFRGASVAMGAFGDAIKAIGRLIADLDVAFETFIGSAGTFFGGLFEGAADALNQPAVDKGLMQLSAGLVNALEGVLPYLPRIAETFGGFLGLLGTLAETALPAAASVLEALMPSIDGIIAAVEDVLPQLSDVVTEVANELGPAIADFVEAVGPVLVDAFVELANALVDILPVLRQLIEALADFVEATREWTESNQGFFDGIRELLGMDVGAIGGLEELKSLLTPTDDGKWWTIEVVPDLNLMWDNRNLDVGTKAQQIAALFVEEYEKTLRTEGKGAANALLEQMRDIDGIPQEVIDRIEEQLELGITIKAKTDLKPSERTAIDQTVKMIADAFEKGGSEGATDVWNSWVMGIGSNKDPISPELRHWIAKGIEDLGVELDTAGMGAGGGLTAGLARGFALGYPTLDTEVQNLRDGVGRSLGDTSGLLTPAGRSTIGGFQNGLAETIPGMLVVAGGIAFQISDAMSSASEWLTPRGRQAMGGLKAGAEEVRPDVVGVFGGIEGLIRGAMSFSLYSIGANLMHGLAAGMRDNSGAVEGAARNAVRNAVLSAQKTGEIHSPSRLTAREVGAPLAQGIAVGIQRNSHLVTRSMNKALDLSGVDTAFSGSGSRTADQSDASAAPLINNLTLQSSGDVRADLEEVNFYLRTIRRGGRNVR